MVGVAGAALRGDVDDVEAGQGRDHRHGDADADLLAQAGHRDGEELAHRPGAVEPGRLVQRRVDLAHAGEQQERAQAEQHPCADHADRGQRGGEVAQPGPGHAAEADRARAPG